ncbi:universal stress protein [Leisingera sp. McT4-56]|uniref:universal stress protein n=1 Tax=Leisingera sp. McT4-56 TaxID=2881255 RepID=UPI001CF89BFC|nr:universal stress protein [Leisingera sp. McT4-56]MCB4458390.1 universal stress protein [Leisingera sp. McT4-56]
MYKNILVPIAPDHGADSASALQAARLLADSDARITALTVADEIPGYVVQQLPEGLLENTRAEMLAELKADLGGVAGVKADVVTGHAGRTITDYAEAHGADCIVIASHRPGLQDYFLGSTAARVVRHAKCTVVVIR